MRALCAWQLTHQDPCADPATCICPSYSNLLIQVLWSVHNRLMGCAQQACACGCCKRASSPITLTPGNTYCKPTCSYWC